MQSSFCPSARTTIQPSERALESWRPDKSVPQKTKTKQSNNNNNNNNIVRGFEYDYCSIMFPLPKWLTFSTTLIWFHHQQNHAHLVRTSFEIWTKCRVCIGHMPSWLSEQCSSHHRTWPRSLIVLLMATSVAHGYDLWISRMIGARILPYLSYLIKFFKTPWIFIILTRASHKSSPRSAASLPLSLCILWSMLWLVLNEHHYTITGLWSPSKKIVPFLHYRGAASITKNVMQRQVRSAPRNIFTSYR